MDFAPVLLIFNFGPNAVLVLINLITIVLPDERVKPGQVATLFCSPPSVLQVQ